jgi:hypothetical protein
MPISPKMIRCSGYIGNTGGEDDGTARCFGFSLSLGRDFVTAYSLGVP